MVPAPHRRIRGGPALGACPRDLSAVRVLTASFLHIFDYASYHPTVLPPADLPLAVNSSRGFHPGPCPRLLVPLAAGETGSQAVL